MKSLALALLVALTAAFLGGCTGKTPDDSTIPHARPAAWEGGLPGFGPGGGF